MTFHAALSFAQENHGIKAYDALLPFLEERAMQVPVDGYEFNVIALGETRSSDGKVFGASLGYIPAGEQIPPHYHEQADACVHILQGSGLALHGEDNWIKYVGGEAYEIPAMMHHGFKAKTDTVFYATQGNNGIITPEKGMIDIKLL